MILFFKFSLNSNINLIEKLKNNIGEYTEKDNNQSYGIVSKLLGNCRFMVLCDDDVERLCHLRGKIRNRMWIRHKDIVLVSFREYEINKGDIIMRYTPKQIKKLISSAEIPEDFDKKII